MENNKNLNQELMREMFNKIRNAEIKNINIQKYDDKQMVARIMQYVDKKVKEEDV